MKPSRSSRVLAFGLALTLLVLVVEAAAGVWSHSLALLSDAGHVLTDVAALGLAWFAVVQGERPATARRTFGYHRIGILVALSNAAFLLVVVGWIGWQALQRLQHPEPVLAPVVIAVAALALAVNLFIARQLAGVPSSLNVRAAGLHVVGDLLASAGVLAAGLVIALTGWYAADALVSLAIAALIAVGAWSIVQEAVDILMEATPAGVDTERLVEAVRKVGGVRELHDLHIWAVTSDVRALSAHLLVEDQMITQADRVQQDVRELLAHEFGIEHATLQLEGNVCGPGTTFCVLREGHRHVESGARR
jgi:cobalt-zinc-cadmium efflux system protein